MFISMSNQEQTSLLKNSIRVIVVEDHLDLRQAFLDGLKSEGIDAVGVSCGEELDELIPVTKVDLLILDINLPGESGFDIAKRVRLADSSVNIIMLSARASEEDRIHSYESGADYYLSKPVSLLELSAAVRAVQRRVLASRADRVEGGGLVLSIASMHFAAEAGRVDLSKSDVAFLKALALAPEHRLPYWRLFEVTERSADDPQAKSQLELQVFRLRKKLAEIGVPNSLIRSVRSEGYQLTQPIHIDN